MKNMFARHNARGCTGEVKAWVVKHLDLSKEELVTGTKLACLEFDFPPVETFVTVNSADGARRSWHIHQPLAEIDEAIVESSIDGT